MVRALQPPHRPLPKTTHLWWWQPNPTAKSWQWCRVYHQSHHTPNGTTFRHFGPLARFDHHHSADEPAHDPARAVLYLGSDLATSACEVFGDKAIAELCPAWRVCILTPTRKLAMFDLTAAGAAMAIGALPSLSDGNESRSLTQQWARAIYEDQPAEPAVTGVRYRSAYNNGAALALWDCENNIEVLPDRHGRLQDIPLTDKRVLSRLQIRMSQRRINVTTIPASACPICART